MSQYFPKNSVYFYSFPAGEDSCFYNAVAPWIEELVAARTAVCAGQDMKVVTFASTSSDEVRHMLEDECGVAILPKDKMIILPESITCEVEGHDRNRKIKTALKVLLNENEFIMAQPFLNGNLGPVYRIPPDLTIWLNDKKNLGRYVPQSYLPRRYSEFRSGCMFAECEESDVSFPCVVKVSSSSSGDGVRICRTAEDFVMAKKDFSSISGSVIIEEFIDFRKNYCIQFGVPDNPLGNIEIIGYNEQIIDADGEFLGGMVKPNGFPPAIDEISRILVEDILPKVRAMGWYGVGGFDVLVDKRGGIFFIDANFRMTATFAFVCKRCNGHVKKPVVSFMAKFKGSSDEFRKKILSLSKEGYPNQRIEIVALSRSAEGYMFNGGMLFDRPEDIKRNAKDLLSLGLESKTLTKLYGTAESLL